MPIYEIQCQDCQYTGEVLVIGQSEAAVCPSCGSSRTEKRISATSSLTGKSGPTWPSHAGSCCGANPPAAGCAGPGSCCGHSH